mmetsp:Transcript_4929/g.12355  ORF Transcript_4929/g.12355 Transcript_4929/m.12355 type:complete len:243 (+) Transcript_4929:871-1599(+)
MYASPPISGSSIPALLAFCSASAAPISSAVLPPMTVASAPGLVRSSSPSRGLQSTFCSAAISLNLASLTSGLGGSTPRKRTMRGLHPHSSALLGSMAARAKFFPYLWLNNVATTLSSASSVSLGAAYSTLATASLRSTGHSFCCSMSGMRTASSSQKISSTSYAASVSSSLSTPSTRMRACSPAFTLEEESRKSAAISTRSLDNEMARFPLRSLMRPMASRRFVLHFAPLNGAPNRDASIGL